MSIYRTTAIKLSDNVLEGITQKVQVLKTCTVYHPTYGKVEINRTMLDEMVSNFKNKVRGIEVMIDYAHDSEREAAGWIKDLEIINDPLKNEDQLWANVEWTPKGRKTLADREFAYLSADFDPDYRHNENPVVSFGAVLLGAGLTNRPVIKNMESIIKLSEFSQVPEENKYKEQKMDKVEMPEEKNLELEKKEKLLGDVKKMMEDLKIESIEDLMKMITELQSKSAEQVEMASKLMEAEKKLSELNAEKIMNEKIKKFNELMTNGHVVEAQREQVLKLSEENFNSFCDIAKLNKVLKLSEQGHGKTVEKKEANDPEEEILKLARKLSDEKKITIDKAISIVLSENSELANKLKE